MLFAGRSIAVPNNKTRVVDRLGTCKDLNVASRKITDVIEIEHLTIGKQKGVNRAVVCRRKSNDLSSRVGAERATLSAAKRAKIAHASIGITKCVIRSCSLDVGRAGDSLGAIGNPFAAHAAERAEIVHRAVGVKERVIQTIGGLGEADDLAGGIDGAGGTGGAAERT